MTFRAFEYDGYLVDLDGTLVSANRPLPGAAWFVRRFADKMTIVSNDAEHTPEELSDKLGALGLPVSSEAIVLAGATAIDELARIAPGARVMLLASASLAGYAVHKGLRPSTTRCDFVLVGRDRRLSYARLARAAAAVAEGVPMWMACPDTSHRGPSGEPVPETGAIAAAIMAVAGVSTCHIVGKPQPTLFEIACRRTGSRPEHMLMIGDNPETDGRGAAAIGMDFLEVHPGDLGPGLFETRLAAEA